MEEATTTWQRDSSSSVAVDQQGADVAHARPQRAAVEAFFDCHNVQPFRASQLAPQQVVLPLPASTERVSPRCVRYPSCDDCGRIVLLVYNVCRL